MDDARAPRRLAGKLTSRLRRGSGGSDEPTPAVEASPSAEPGQDPLVSVVVPVYAVEQYIDECLTSILAQTYRNL